ncbi:hypothetical protein [Lysobacter gummosus]|uniref:hypothetical protein n=1 Tax=Lysobacter gummosus TaxID=262324 RepID=UPI0036265B65
MPQQKESFAPAVFFIASAIPTLIAIAASRDRPCCSPRIAWAGSIPPTASSCRR